MRQLPLFFCCLLLGWGALPYVPAQIDDAFIVFAYAHRLADFGEVAWNTGERVEGYSSVLHLLLMAGMAEGGLDLSFFSRVLSLGCAVGILGWCLHPSTGPGRRGLALLLAAWQPLQYWATSGLETTLGALIAAIAWPMVLGDRQKWAYGTWGTILFALTRPEGTAWLGLALLRRLFLGRSIGKPEYQVMAGVGVWLLYHLLRVWYFGHLLPTPFLVKLEGVHDWMGGLSEGGRELVSSLAILLWVVGHRRFRVACWLPLMVQLLVLVRAGGDWMGNGRFLLPGLVAGALASMQTLEYHRVPLWKVVTTVLFGLGLMGTESARNRGQEYGIRDRWLLFHPLEILETPWGVPMLSETSFLIGRIPPQAGALLSDVGLPGNLGDVRIWDAAGLTDRLTAEILAGYYKEMPEVWRSRYDDDDDVWCFRYEVGADGKDTAPEWMQQMFPEIASAPSSDRVLRWRCRAGGEPSPEVVLRRWDQLLHRFPSQDWIRWESAHAHLLQGQVDEALTIADQAYHVQETTGWLIFNGVKENYRPGRGWGMYGNGTLSSAPLADTFWEHHRLVLEVEDPGEAGAQVVVERCGMARTLQVMKREEVPVVACASAEALTLRYVNDAANPDQNVYVSVTEEGE